MDVFRTMQRLLFIALAAAHLPLPCAGTDARTGVSLSIAGTNIVPHVQSPNLRWRKPADPELGARVELFIQNTGDDSLPITPDFECLFGGQSALQLLESGDWAWHDTPSARSDTRYDIPPGAMTVWSFNSRKANWGVGTRHSLALGSDEKKGELQLEEPPAWISAVTFLSDEENIRPDRMIVHVANETGAPMRIRRCRLWLPASGESFMVLKRGSWLEGLEPFPSNSTIPDGKKGGFSVKTPQLPLTYTAVEVEWVGPDKRTASIWAHLRIKREVFDLSGGWVASDINGRNSLTVEPYLRTLKRMHINTGQIEEVGGYTDNPKLYERYPLKRFNRLANAERYSSDAMLSQIHAVEFLGEPQYGGGRPVPPQEVWEAFEPYQKTRLHTTVTHSEERIWRYYAGLSDYPHYDAYRVTAPAADSWRRYDRWGGDKISWGAPLETITDLTRSLRDLNRPRPIAYWSQGAHDGWRSFSRKRSSPTPDELRAQAYHALAHRITSIYWFNLSLKSLLKFPDLIEPITEVNRVALTLEPLILSGDALEYRRSTVGEKLDWDLSSITGPEGGLFFANDLTYAPDPKTRTFTFSQREANLNFRLPSYLEAPAEVFRVDAKGLHDVEYEVIDGLLKVSDRIRVTGIYVASIDGTLRPRLAEMHAALLSREANYGSQPEDLSALRAVLDRR